MSLVALNARAWKLDGGAVAAGAAAAAGRCCWASQMRIANPNLRWKSTHAEGKDIAFSPLSLWCNRDLIRRYLLSKTKMRPPLIPQPIPFHGHEQEHVKLLKTLYNTLVEYRDPQTDRIIISIFMCLPSRKDFPEYFEIIKRPISMYEIRKRIENGVYQSVEPCLNDFRLMFDNCRTFNEDGSMIFQDAVRLEELLFDKYDQCIENESGNATREDKPHSPVKSEAVAPLEQTNNTPQSRLHPQSHGAPMTNGSSSTLRLTKKKLAKLAKEQAKLHNSSAPSYPINDNSFASPLQRQQYPSHSTPLASHSPRLTKKKAAKLAEEQARLLDPSDQPTPKKRLLTGYIIYAAEVRKEYVDKHPNQDFGFISRLIGNDWKALSKEVRLQYDQRALVHNKKMREKSLRDSMIAQQERAQFPYYDNHHSQSQGSPMTNGSSTPKLTKKKLAKLAKEQARLHNSSAPYPINDNSFATPMRHQDQPSHSTRDTTQQGNFGQQSSAKSVTVATQTAPIRFVEPPAIKRHVYAENFERYIEGLGVPNMDLVAEEVACLDKPPEPVETWLGAGTGRHGSKEAALWALRDFMLQDSETMRLNMQPYLYYSQGDVLFVDAPHLPSMLT